MWKIGMMNKNILCITISIAIFSTIMGQSYGMIDGNLGCFQETLNCNGKAGCAMDTPSATSNETQNKQECATKCFNKQPPCVNFNYLENEKSCQLFDYIPYKILDKPFCSNYDVIPRKRSIQKGSNLALHRRTCQSTTSVFVTPPVRMDPWLGVDGLHGIDAWKDCPQTALGGTANNWYMVDLEMPTVVSYVKILPKTVSSPEHAIRYRNLIVGVSNDSWLERTPIIGQYQVCGTNIPPVYGGWFQINCPSTISPARYVIAQQTPDNANGAGYLSVCEFEVY